MLQGRKEASFELKTVRDWNFMGDGYEVVLEYLFTVPEGEFPGLVTVRGVESLRNEFAGRQWFVELDSGKTALIETPGATRLTDHGQALRRVIDSGGAFIPSEVQKAFGSPDRMELFLLTLPRSERAEARKAINQARPAGAVAGSASLLAHSSETLSRFHSFLDGSLLTADKDRLNDARQREELLTAARKVFAQGPGEIRPDIPQTIPLRERRGDRFLLLFDLRLDQRQVFSAEGTLTLEGDARSLESKNVQPNWRLAGMNLLTGKKFNPESRERPGP
jgi:hypothetical protein